jgi:hypothetical protein
VLGAEVVLVLEGLEAAILDVANTTHQEKCVHVAEGEKNIVEGRGKIICIL